MAGAGVAMTRSQQTVASLVREAAKSEAAFLNTLNEVLAEDEPERIEEFFAKLNIPRSSKTDDTLVEETAPTPPQAEVTVAGFAQELQITDGIQKFLDRHMRKLKWHVAHPGLEGIGNCMRLYRAMAVVGQLRVRRVLALLGSKPRLTVEEWGTARELLNRAYREYREATAVVAGPWIDALLTLDPQAEVKQALTGFPGMVAENAQAFKDLRDAVEVRRQQLEVKPENYPAVKPPRYFGGDLLSGSSWRHFWGELSGMTDALRNSLGL